MTSRKPYGWNDVSFKPEKFGVETSKGWTPAASICVFEGDELIEQEIFIPIDEYKKVVAGNNPYPTFKDAHKRMRELITPWIMKKWKNATPNDIREYPL